MIWGLTGGIACGKSTVASILQQGGWAIIDSDEIAHRLMEPGEENWQKIVDAFGENVLKGGRTINRRILGDLIFHDSQLREKLNDITHPAIRRVWLEERGYFMREQPSRSVAVVLPLLFEKNLREEFARILCVGCSSRTQRQRLISRGLDAPQVETRMQGQWSVADKLKLADLAIWNEGTLETLQGQIELFAGQTI